MLRIRLFEDRVRREFGKGDMPGLRAHVRRRRGGRRRRVLATSRDADLITSTHRGHGHCLAKGVPIAPIVAELYGRETGLCKGRGGSMHVADFSKGMLGANAIVGGGISLAVGGALAAQTLGDGRVAVTFFGDGASNQGIFHESLNLAAIWRLPVVFVCENNGWAESTPIVVRGLRRRTSPTRPAAYGIPGVTVDAADVEAVLDRRRQRPSIGHGGATVRRCSRRGSAGSAGTTSAIPRTYRSRDDRRLTRATPTRSTRPANGSTRRASTSASSSRAVETASSPSSTPRSPTLARRHGPIPSEVERDVFAG